MATSDPEGFMTARFLLPAAGALALLVASARADDVAQFYAGKTISFIVGYGAGGSYDSGARLVARHMGKYIPGKPSMVVQNMMGGGGMTLSNHLYNVAAKDGTVLGMSGRGLYLEALFGNPLVKFDPLKLEWIGSHGREASVLVVAAKAPFKTVEDIRRDELILSTASPGADTYSYALVLRHMLDAKVRMITGFQSQPEAFLAMERGEVHGNAGATVGTISAVRPKWLTEPGLATFIVQMATVKHPKFFQGVPLIMDYAKNDIDRQALALTFARQNIAYAFSAPPGVPAERVKVLRAALMATTKDKEFLAEAERMNTDVAPVDGEGVAAVIRQAYTMPAAVIERAKAVLTTPK
jgi:tripartite-type tricarboxylate transporter receptor subunit TctC